MTDTAITPEDPTALADYHNTRMAEEARAAERERLIDIAAEGVYGMGLDNPIGCRVVDEIGRGIVTPVIDALLNHDDVVIAVETQSSPS